MSMENFVPRFILDNQTENKLFGNIYSQVAPEKLIEDLK